MITIVVGMGLLVLTLVLLLRNRMLLLAAVLIPILYGGYYYLSNEVPKKFGYAVSLQFVDIKEAMVLDAFTKGESIYILLVNKGDTEPRLVSLPNTKSNKDMITEINEKIKKSMVVIKKSGSGSGSNGDGNEATGDLQIVPMEEQTIIKKETE